MKVALSTEKTLVSYDMCKDLGDALRDLAKVIGCEVTSGVLFMVNESTTEICFEIHGKQEAIELTLRTLAKPLDPCRAFIIDMDMPKEDEVKINPEIVLN